MSRDEQIQERLTYTPGKSSTPVAARRKDPRATLREIETFTDRHACGSIAEGAMVIANDDDTFMKEGAGAAGFSAAREHFGAPERTGGNVWIVGLDELASAIELVFELHEEWPGDLPPLSLHLTWHFLWKEFSRGTVPDDSNLAEVPGRRSRLGVNLFYKQRVGFFPTLDFPFAWEAPEREGFIARISEDSPFPIHRAHFRRVFRLADGSWGKIRKI